MRPSIHPLVFLLGSLLLSATWLVLWPPLPAPASTAAAFGATHPTSPPRTERKTIELGPEILGRYVGSYRLDTGPDVAIELDAGRLFAEAEGTPRYELRPTAETEFYVAEIDADLTFELD